MKPRIWMSGNGFAYEFGYGQSKVTGWSRARDRIERMCRAFVERNRVDRGGLSKSMHSKAVGAVPSRRRQSPP